MARRFVRDVREGKFETLVGKYVQQEEAELVEMFFNGKNMADMEKLSKRKNMVYLEKHTRKRYEMI